MTAVHSEPSAKRTRLVELGLDEETLKQSIRAGLAQWADCTPHHPPSYPGLSAWGESVKTLRDGLAPHGWIASNEANLPFTVNAAGTVALAVATGDEATGKVGESPCTKSSKGPRTAHAVAENAAQLRLFPVEVKPEALTSIGGNGRRVTWLLLFYRDELNLEVRSELSRPTSMDENQRVAGWVERIILEPIGFDVNPSIAATPEGTEIDIQIRRRS